SWLHQSAGPGNDAGFWLNRDLALASVPQSDTKSGTKFLYCEAQQLVIISDCTELKIFSLSVPCSCTLNMACRNFLYAIADAMRRFITREKRFGKFLDSASSRVMRARNSGSVNEALVGSIARMIFVAFAVASG